MGKEAVRPNVGKAQNKRRFLRRQIGSIEKNNKNKRQVEADFVIIVELKGERFVRAS